MGYLIEQSQIVKVVSTFQPAQIITMGSSPLDVISRSDFLIPFYIVMKLTTGTTPYNFGAADHFAFYGNSGIFFDASPGYTLQTIQNDEYHVGYARTGFKLNTIGVQPFNLTLSTVTGLNATQGDGVLTINTYCVKL